MSNPLSGPWAVVLCNFNDVPIPPESTDYYRGYVSEAMNGYYSSVSYGALDLSQSVFTGWHTMNYSWVQNWYHDGTLRRQAWFDEGVRLADKAGFRFDPFYGILVVINAPADDSAVTTGAQPLRNVSYPKGFGQVVLNTSHGLGQTNWWYCNKCFGLFFGGNPSLGVCAADHGAHDYTGSGAYLAVHDVAGFPGEAGWRWCSKCQQLVHGAGVCAASGQHDMTTPSYNYIVGLDLNPQMIGCQNNWWRCANCDALGYATGLDNLGPCPAGGKHDYISNNSPNYSMVWATHNLNLSMGPHEFGHGYGLKHSRRLNDPGDDYGDTWDIMGAGQYYQGGGTYAGNTGPGVHGSNLIQMGCLPQEMLWEYELIPGGPNLKTVELVALNAPADWGGFRVARFYANPVVYTVEFRQPYQFDGAFPRAGLLVHQTTDRNYLCPSSSDGNNFDWQPGQVYDDPVNNFRVTVNSINKFVQRATVTLGPCVHEQGNWRWCGKCQGLAYNGNPTAGGCPDGGPHNFVGSGDYVLTHDTLGASGQPNWRFCRKCFGLVFAGNAPGPCPGGTVHDTSASYNYILANNSATFDGQDNWRWCSKCQGLAFAGNNTPGVCPADNSGHALGASADYYLAHDVVRPYGQRSWRYCRKCQGLVYSESKLPGACPNGDVHDLSQSADYYLVHDLPGALGQDNWRWCSKCQGLAFGGNTPAGVCPNDHQPHALSSSYDYILAHDISGAPGQDSWRWCSRCQGLVYNGGTAGNCPAGGTHTLNAQLFNYRLVNNL